ncbi:MAG: chitobiase/beta-hexosaminidase C-terminal domain-containing protein, partial [Dermabacter sp.]|nr:chitobiase/beta-hexosaminidase C-terminal domain-containing protein [Dermabacter sp.]
MNEQSTVTERVHDIAARAKRAQRTIARENRARKDSLLRAIAAKLDADCARILEANAEDLARADESGIDRGLRDRLALNPSRVKAIAAQVRATTALADPVGEVVRGGVQPLQVGSNRIDILVTAEDQQEQATYTLHVKRLLQAEQPEQVSKPAASPAGGAVPSGTRVTLSTATEGATIYYTTDGSEPASSSTEYSVPIEVTTEMTLKAIAAKDGMLDSDVMEEQYTIATIPAPANLTASSADRSVTLKWEAVTGTGSVTYAVYQAEGTSAPVDPANWKLIQSNVPANSYIVTGLTNGTT